MCIENSIMSLSIMTISADNGFIMLTEEMRLLLRIFNNNNF